MCLCVCVCVCVLRPLLKIIPIRLLFPGNGASVGLRRPPQIRPHLPGIFWFTWRDTVPVLTHRQGQKDFDPNALIPPPLRVDTREGMQAQTQAHIRTRTHKHVRTYTHTHARTSAHTRTHALCLHLSFHTGWEQN